MKIRLKSNPEITGFSNSFNTHGLSEIIVGFDEGDMTSDSVDKYEVLIGNNWKDMSAAFDNRDIIPDNYNQYFAIPKNEEERARGYYY
jgi:hypothetical protein